MKIDDCDKYILFGYVISYITIVFFRCSFKRLSESYIHKLARFITALGAIHLPFFLFHMGSAAPTIRRRSQIPVDKSAPSFFPEEVRRNAVW
jgi:hypothetical protein